MPVIGWVAELLGFIMDGLFRMTSAVGIMNIGLCIILFTLVVKILMFPMTLNQQKSSKIMAVMQPEIKKVQEKYKGKQDQASMAKMQQETQAIYEKYGTSMTGGCVQLVIQMPILLALYQVIYKIPAYVSGVRVYFDAVANAVMSQPGYLEKISDLATAAKSPVTDGSIDKVVDFLYKLTPVQWDTLQGVFSNAPDVAGIIAANSAPIIKMNSFLGINLATAPYNGTFIPNVAWLIPILAGLSQWYSTKLMSANQTPGDDSQSANMMKSMSVTMPLMSAFFCFTFAAGIGVYWVASSVVQIVQQLAINAHLNKTDLDELIRQNVEKANKKRAKKGLPPTNLAQAANYKAMKSKEEDLEAKRAAQIEKSKEIEKESKEYYSTVAADEDPGSMAAKARMVKRYNEKHVK
ncbi:MAG: YidC/Oxa1 family membrane protein insertase [Lachnospiraceae bacterium]|jgi:YidC/Oxa1 family membrane protein insertase|nr:YidC/Oxa1 family membrane protein insertase [Lachnospiraceae bacterium]